MNPEVAAAITRIEEQAEQSIRCPQAVWDEEGCCWICNMQVAEVNSEWEVNITGPLLTQGIAKQMVGRGEGHIVWVSSREGLNVNPFTGIYSASKHALEAIAETMADELQVGDLDLARYLPQVTARFTSTNVLAQVEAACHGAGIGLLPKYLALREPTLRRVCAPVAPLRSRFSLAVRRDSVSRPNVRAVREAIFEQVHARAHEMR